jgi:hypothetical protein
MYPSPHTYHWMQIPAQFPLHAMITIGREEGVRALWSGFVPRLLWSATFFAVGISTYEAVLGAYAMLSCLMLSCLPSFLTTICLPSFLTSSLPSPCCTLFPLSRFPLHNRCELGVANVWACYPAVCPLCDTVRTVTLSPFAWPPRLLHFPRVALRSLSRAVCVARTRPVSQPAHSLWSRQRGSSSRLWFRTREARS